MIGRAGLTPKPTRVSPGWVYLPAPDCVVILVICGASHWARTRRSPPYPVREPFSPYFDLVILRENGGHGWD